MVSFLKLSVFGTFFFFLNTLSLSWNQISGSIPEEIIGYLNLFQNIDLIHNNITGEIPFKLGDSQHLVVLDLSYNNLIGNIPDFSISMKEINFSYNSLQGQIPNCYLNFSLYTFIGNKDLCGDFKDFPPCHPSSPHNNRSIVLVLAFLPVLVILGCVFLFRSEVKKTKSNPRETKNGD